MRKSYSALALVAFLPFGLAAYACGSKQPPPDTATNPSASATTAPTDSATGATTSDTSSATSSATTAEVPPPPTATGSKKVEAKKDPAWASCHASYKATSKDKNLPADVAAMAKACAGPTKMHLVGKTLTGEQGDENPPQSFPLKADAKHCYRVYAYAASTIKDLDLAIKDSSNELAGADDTDDPSPVVLEDGAVCFKEADSATVVVSVGMGKGKYAVQIWSD